MREKRKEKREKHERRERATRETSHRATTPFPQLELAIPGRATAADATPARPSPNQPLSSAAVRSVAPQSSSSRASVGAPNGDQLSASPSPSMPERLVQKATCPGSTPVCNHTQSIEICQTPNQQREGVLVCVRGRRSRGG